MKRLLKKKIIAILIASILVLVLSGTAYAFYRASVPSHVKIVEPEANPRITLEFFEDKDCTTPCYFVEWGEIAQGETSAPPILFYIQNTGRLKAYITGTDDLPSNVGEMVIKFQVQPITYHTWTILDPEEVVGVRAWFTIDDNAPLGDIDFNIIIKAEEYS